MPEVLAAGRFGPSRDAALVTRLPDGRALAEADAAALPDATLDELLRSVLRLREADIAHGALGAETIIVSADGGVCLRDFRCASSSAPRSRLDGDLAAALAAIGGAGGDRADRRRGRQGPGHRCGSRRAGAPAAFGA